MRLLAALLVALLACLISVLAEAQNLPLKKVQLLAYLVDYEASWSPNGRSIVLISNRHAGLKVHILQSDEGGSGSTMRQITTGPNEDDAPAFSPDGNQSAFVSVHNDVDQPDASLVSSPESKIFACNPRNSNDLDSVTAVT